MADAWYVGQGQDRRGPFTTEELRGMAASGELKPTSLIWRKGLTTWMPASKAKGLFQASDGPPPLPKADAAPPPLPASEAKPRATGAWANFTDSNKPWSTGWMVGLVIATILLSPLSIGFGIYGMTKKAKKSQGRILLAVSIGVFILFLATLDLGANNRGGYVRSRSAPARPPAARNQLPPGVHDAELWAQVRRDCSALSFVEQRSTYEMLLIKKRSDQRTKASRRMYAPMGR